MNAAGPSVANPTGFTGATVFDSSSGAFLIALVRERLCSGLRSLLVLGSCLSSETRRPDSIPDLFALVDDLDTALLRLGSGTLARGVSSFLPPTTVSLCASPHGPPIAKLNLIEPAVLARAIRTLPDLYLAGRLSKRSILLDARTAACDIEMRHFIDEASSAVAGAALLGLPRRVPIEAAVRRCFDISYLAEVRPETPAKLRARFDTFAPFYMERFTPLLARRAYQRGLTIESGAILDNRPEAIRRSEASELARLLFRSRLRSMARWPKQAIVYRGWAVYLAAKLRRSRSVT